MFGRSRSNWRWIVCAAALVGACGGSGGGGAGGTGGSSTGAGGSTTDGGAAGAAGGGGSGTCAANGPGSTPGSMMTWVVDGTADCAEFVSSTHSTKNGFDTLTVVGGNTKNHAVNFKVTVPSGAIELGKDYACDVAYVQLIYSAGPMNGVATTYPSSTCTITITSLGSATTPATGTFSGVLAGDAGAHMVSDGTFTAVPHIMN